jgi:hypothetical protein
MIRWTTLKGWTREDVKMAKAAYKADSHRRLVARYVADLARQTAMDESTTVWVVEDTDEQLGYLYEADYDVAPGRTDFTRVYGYDWDGNRIEV